MKPKVSIIILNWNGWGDTIECLESLHQISYPNYDVIIVDNGSGDRSVEKIKEYAEGKIKVESKFFKYDPSNKPLKYIEYIREEAEAGGGKEKEIEDLTSNGKLIIIKNEKNYGFAEGNNIAIRYALKAWNSDYVLILNNDTVVDKNFLSELIKVAEDDEKVGIVGGKIHKYYNINEIESFGEWVDLFGYPFNIYSTIDKNSISYVGGACFLVRSNLIDKYSLYFDSDFFLLYEETDLCWRARIFGFDLKCSAYSLIYHKRYASFKKSDINSYYFLERNRILSLLKNLESRTLFKLGPMILFNEIIRSPFWICSGRFATKIRSYISILQNLNKFLKKREDIKEKRKLTDKQVFKSFYLGWYKLPSISIINRAINLYLRLLRII